MKALFNITGTFLNFLVFLFTCTAYKFLLLSYLFYLPVSLYGPTNFAPVIKHVAQFARSHQDGNNYFVLLIITDGIICGKLH